MSLNKQDDKHLAHALHLARAGIGFAAPNPCVGALLVDGKGKVLGEGTHNYNRKKHAEILALEQAGKKAKSATLFINLEPCCHTGRTSPCTDALIAAGVKRVVAAMADPNPKVAGQGFAKLRNAGIDVHVETSGDHYVSARRLNEHFAKFITTGFPLVTLKAGMTLDGKIALPPDSEAMSSPPASRGWITSEEARAHVQTLRHASDAILVGVGTILSDDPLLTDRSGLDRNRPLLRAVLDSQLRIPLNSKLVNTADGDVIIFCAFAEENKRQELEKRGVQVEALPLWSNDELMVSGGRPLRSAHGRADIRELVRRLGEMQITSLLIEGGALVNWMALAAGIVDKVFLYYAPKILGGTGAVPFAGGEGFERLSDAATVRNITMHHFTEDFAVEGYLRDPYAASTRLQIVKD